MTPVAGAEPAAGCCCGDGLALTGRGTPTQLRVGGSGAVGGPGPGWRLGTHHRQHITPYQHSLSDNGGGPITSIRQNGELRLLG